MLVVISHALIHLDLVSDNQGYNVYDVLEFVFEVVRFGDYVGSYWTWRQVRFSARC